MHFMHLLLSDFGFTAWEDILNLMNADSGRIVQSKSHQILKDRNQLILKPIAELETSEFTIEKGVNAINHPIAT